MALLLRSQFREWRSRAALERVPLLNTLPDIISGSTVFAFLKNISYLAKTIWPLQNTDGTGSKASLKFLRKLTSCALRLTSLLMLQDQEISVSFSFFTTATPTRTHFINGLNS